MGDGTLRVSQRCPSNSTNGQETSVLDSLIGFLLQESIRPAPLATSSKQREGEAGGRGRGGGEAKFERWTE